MNNFEKLCERILQEQYTITGREVLYRRYGKDVADRMISKIIQRGSDEYLEKKYNLPNYNKENLDRIIELTFNKFHEADSSGQGSSAAKNRKIITVGPFGSRHETDNIVVNSNYSNIANPISNELNKNINSSKKSIPQDVLGHEITHSLQKGSNYNFNSPMQAEIAPVLGELKRWYYEKTGILLDADATDNQINQFIKYCKDRNIFNNVGYGKNINFEKLLRTSEGKEVFRRVVKQTSAKTNTMVA